MSREGKSKRSACLREDKIAGGGEEGREEEEEEGSPPPPAVQAGKPEREDHLLCGRYFEKESNAGGVQAQPPFRPGAGFGTVSPNQRQQGHPHTSALSHVTGHGLDLHFCTPYGGGSTYKKGAAQAARAPNVQITNIGRNLFIPARTG